MVVQNFRIRILMFGVLLTFIIGSACTSSNSSLQTNPNYNRNFNSPTRTPEKYANPNGLSEAENKIQADLPVSIMQISLEVSQVEVNQPYNLYSLVSNPSLKDVQYEWRVTSGKLLPVTEEDKPRLKGLADKAIEMAGVGGTKPDGTTPVTPAAGTDKTVDGKLVPGTVPPDDALKNRPSGATPAAGEFKEGEPVPPPQIQPQGSGTRVEPGQPAGRTPSEAIPPPVEITTDGGSLSTNIIVPPPVTEVKDPELASAVKNKQVASAWIDKAFGVRFALLAMQDNAGPTTEESTSDGDQDTNSESAESSDEETPDDGENVTTSESDEVQSDILKPEGSGRIEDLFADFDDAETSTTTSDESMQSAFDRETKLDSSSNSTKHWPTPWESGGKNAIPDSKTPDASDKLITDIQKQITNELADKTAADNAIKQREPVKMLTSEPYVRWIPDTAESVTISLILVNPKGIKLTEPTVLDVEVTTPQPKAELSFAMPKEGLEPGDKLDVAFKVSNIPDYRRSLIGVNFDLNNFDVSTVRLGDLFDNGNNATLYYAQPDKSSGMLTVAISLQDLIRSVRGSGQAFVITFEAKAMIPADTTELGFSISKEANFRYIQDVSGDNQLPPDASTLPTLQSKFEPPPMPEQPAPAGTDGTAMPGSSGVAGTGGAVVPGGLPGAGGAPQPGRVVLGPDGLPIEGAGARTGGHTPVAPGGAVPAGMPNVTPPLDTQAPPPDQPPVDDDKEDGKKKPPANNTGAPVSSVG